MVKGLQRFGVGCLVNFSVVVAGDGQDAAGVLVVGTVKLVPIEVFLVHAVHHVAQVQEEGRLLRRRPAGVVIGPHEVDHGGLFAVLALAGVADGVEDDLAAGADLLHVVRADDFLQVHHRRRPSRGRDFLECAVDRFGLGGVEMGLKLRRVAEELRRRVVGHQARWRLVLGVLAGVVFFRHGRRPQGMVDGRATGSGYENRRAASGRREPAGTPIPRPYATPAGSRRPLAESFFGPAIIRVLHFPWSNATSLERGA